MRGVALKQMPPSCISRHLLSAKNIKRNHSALEPSILSIRVVAFENPINPTPLNAANRLIG